VDLVCAVPVTPSITGPGAKQQLSGFRRSPGGQVATALAACAAFRLPTRYIGAFGDDEHGRFIAAELSQRGVDLSYAVTRGDTPNRFAVIIVDAQSGERVVLWDRDARLNLDAREIDAAALEGATALHVDDSDIPASLATARLARARGVAVTTDIDRAADGVRDLVALATHPVFSADVLEPLTGAADPEAALRALQQPAHRLLTVTLGEAGALALDGRRLIRVPGIRVHTVDTTGAGDVFRAGLLYGLHQGWAVDDTLAFANAAAAESCTHAGAMTGVPTLDAVRRRAQLTT
jgi:sugar/nucleoside kinase (ribokinase family)